MANILQVTNPVNDGNRNLINTNEPKNIADAQHTQNAVDPTRVVRADGQEGAKTGDAMQEGTLGILDYGSSYGAFIRQLGESAQMEKLLAQLFQAEDASVLFPESEKAAFLLTQLQASIQSDSPEELLAYVKGQREQQAKFSGPFFDGLRALFKGNHSDSAKEAAAEFLRSYNSFSTGQHLLRQMKELSEDIEHLMFRQFHEQYEEILSGMDWEAPNGETEANTAVLNQKLLPFLSSYVSKTHDYGPIRNALMRLIYHAVKYENGEKDRMWQLFDKLSHTRDFEQLANREEARDQLEELLSALDHPQVEHGFADAFSQLMARGANGEAGLEKIQQFYNIMNGMLVNESVYLPLLHLILPFRYQDKEVMSELWVDPDVAKETDEGRRIKLLLKFDIRNVGHFDLLMTLENRQAEMQLYVPQALKEKSEKIGKDIASILKKNGLTMGRMLVREKKGEIKVMDVFPEIREKERTINVRI